MRPTRATTRGGAAPQKITVVVNDEQTPSDAIDIDHARWAALAEASLGDQGVAGGELNVLFVDEAEMADLHDQHMGGHEPTDVLSFPIDADDLDDPLGGGQFGETLLGDVVICPRYAERQAAENGVAFDDELALLVVHGVLHILGMDHAEPDEAAEMKAAEQDLLAKFHAGAA